MRALMKNRISPNSGLMVIYDAVELLYQSGLHTYIYSCIVMQFMCMLPFARTPQCIA